jgi:hypothetical protein
MMMFGREVTLPVDLMVAAVPHEPECKSEFADNLRERIREIHERARHALDMNARRQKKNYDRSVHGPIYKRGQFVWLHDTQRRARLSKKLGLPWQGPYLVVSILSDVVYRIQRTNRGKTKVVHADRLKLYEGPKLVSWTYKPPAGTTERGPELHQVGMEEKGEGGPEAIGVEEGGPIVDRQERANEPEVEGGKHIEGEPTGVKGDGVREKAIEPVVEETEHKEPEKEIPRGVGATGGLPRRSPRVGRRRPARYR